MNRGKARCLESGHAGFGGRLPGKGPIYRDLAGQPTLPSKAALNAVTVTYANELRDHGILVNAVSPGSVATDQNGHRGVLTPDQGAKLPIRMATLPADGPTGTAVTADTDLTQHPLPW
jgi:NAD(P)-dependent dehydrogenase (short-subunit alcohol dehydrogenase family)